MSYLFWISTLIPGLGISVYYFRCSEKYGWLGIMSWSFILTLTLLMPVVIVAYLFHLSIEAVGTYYQFLVMAGMVLIFKVIRLESISKFLKSSHYTEFAAVLVILGITIPLGGNI